MNKEYRKFNDFAEVYIPAATEPEHFSNLPDVLIPQDFPPPEVDPLEKDVTELIKETVTPPETPPEKEKGQAGCQIFGERKHYVSRAFKDEAFQRLFATKLIIFNTMSWIPTFIVMIVFSAWHELDFMLVREPHSVIWTFAAGGLLYGFYIYFVGLFRNPPWLYIGVIAQVLITTVLFSCGMLLIHMAFLNIIHHGADEDAELNQTYARYQAVYVEMHDHSPPYMILLIIVLMSVVNIGITVLLMRYKYSINDYRIPFLIYTSCYSLSAILTTIVLNDGFLNKPLAYDLFQVIVGCYISSMLLMRTPQFITRLFEGKVCPLREEETLYALIHYNL